MLTKTFNGYVRPDGKIGVRNYVLVIPTVICSSSFSSLLINDVKEAIMLTHQYGCAQGGKDLEQTFRVLAGFGKNPNVAGVLIVALGCESLPYEKLADEIAKTGKPVETLVIQEEGYKAGVEKGVKILNNLIINAKKLRRESLDVSELIVAVECGGSDWTSGLLSNPAVGRAIDYLIDHGGKAVFSETPEIIGGEQFLIRRCKHEKDKVRLIKFVKAVFDRAQYDNIDIMGANPAPGNIAGGLSTIEEKSLGAILKSGTQEIVGVLKYAEEIPNKAGCYFMDTPGHDVESICGMVAGGAQIVLFTTGRGTPVGNAIAPVIKITANSDTYNKLHDIIDIYLDTFKYLKNLDIAAQLIYNKIIDVASGEKTKAELYGNREFAINRVGHTY